MNSIFKTVFGLLDDFMSHCLPCFTLQIGSGPAVSLMALETKQVPKADFLESSSSHTRDQFPDISIVCVHA